MDFDFLRLRTDHSYRLELTDWVGEDDALRDKGRLLAKSNLLALCYILGYTKIDPVLHKEALEFFLPRDLTKPDSQQGIGQLTRCTRLYPRGTYKTTLDEADTVQETICFPEDAATFIVSANLNLATAMVDAVAAHFTQRPGGRPTLFRALFPEMLIAPREVESGKFSPPTRRQDPPIREDAVMAFSMESGVSGWHCWRLKGDDIANNRNMKSESSRAEVNRNYGVNRKMLNPGGIEDKLGTRYAPDDPYGEELRKAKPGTYRYVVKPALRLKSGARLDANGFPPEEEMELLFPELLPYSKLQEEYDLDYSAFMTQYMNDAFGDNEVVFPEADVLQMMRPEEQIPLEGRLSIRWRLASKALGWGFSVGVVGIEQGNRMHIVDAVHGAYKPSILAEKVVALARKYDVHQVEIEDAPGAQKMGAAISNHALTSGYALNLSWPEFQADEGERDVRIKSCESFLTGGRLIISRDLSTIRKLFEQFTGYGMVSEYGFPDVISRLCEKLPASIRSTAESLEEGLALEMALQRDHWNALYGQGVYEAREPEPEDAGLGADAEDEGGAPWGLEDIMPGLNA